ncbi:MAG TPA: prephenate dehydratase, partial [Armatimonadota bacterium]|nr:prephenate dehydratase [Armatimonadota bacterium]
MSIEELRARIDALDAEVLSLLNERARLAMEIGHKKAKQEGNYFAPVREKQVIQSLLQKNEGPLPDTAVRSIYREIMSACRALEKPLRVSYWGPPASFTHLASIRRFGAQTEYVACETIADVFTAVSKKQVDYGVVPIENSTEGLVESTLDMFNEADLLICAEIYVPITHNLLSSAPSLSAVRTLYASTQPLAQCRKWLQNHLPAVEIRPVSTTSRAAQLAAEDPTGAAIANVMASEVYGVDVLEAHIEDSPHNRTRFLVIGNQTLPPSGHDKTSLLLSVQHRAGSLYRALSLFDKYDINLTMIESRPSKRTP